MIPPANASLYTSVGIRMSHTYWRRCARSHSNEHGVRSLIRQLLGWSERKRKNGTEALKDMIARCSLAVDWLVDRRSPRRRRRAVVVGSYRFQSESIFAGNRPTGRTIYETGACGYVNFNKHKRNERIPHYGSTKIGLQYEGKLRCGKSEWYMWSRRYTMMLVW